MSDNKVVPGALGKFDHHPDPAVDFEIEVECLQSRLFNAKGRVSKPGTASETVEAVLTDIERAMRFRVGGDVGAVAAKKILRDLEAEAKAALDTPEPVDAGSAVRVVREFQRVALETATEMSPQQLSDLTLWCDKICAALLVDAGTAGASAGAPDAVSVLHLRAQALDEAIEGECAGLSVSMDQCLAILKHVDAATPPTTSAVEAVARREKWNIDLDGDDLLICFNDHEKGEKCDYERFVPAARLTEETAARERAEARLQVLLGVRDSYRALMVKKASKIADLEARLSALSGDGKLVEALPPLPQPWSDDMAGDKLYRASQMKAYARAAIRAALADRSSKGKAE